MNVKDIVADIMIKKYEMAIPICEQVKEIAYYGAFISRGNASNWVIKCGTYWLESLYDRLKEHLLEGICCLSNNIAERSIRPFTVGRKNWLVAGSPKGATASSVIYSIIETCKANKINPRKYLEKVFTELPNRESRFNK